MKETTISTKKYIVKFGIILGAIWVVYGFVRYQVNYMTTSNRGLALFELVMQVFIVTYGIYKYKQDNEKFLKLWEALKIGISIILVGTIIKVLWDIILLKLIAPEAIHSLINVSKPSTIKETTDQLSNLNKENKFLLNISIGIFIGNIILGTIISLLGGAIMQKNRNPF
ncbi:DUF4199 domain-containing protein [Aquimarina sp. U1-2]|uniref:DUF4199 domain-containing protein n=1 Tax=Aquimarina sp. U1-2 TaxID=2823141 RepID=UPI001AECBEA1|nr:DUF4199 domain-containing protein [Aquimarina sp. U1-2]MBP2833077.1 DUF4199 domain-containing protein [Aquimarina sp. U1-2]